MGMVKDEMKSPKDFVDLKIRPELHPNNIIMVNSKSVHLAGDWC
jgi:hypothetical protein